MNKKIWILIGGISAVVIALVIFNLNNLSNLDAYQLDDIIKEGNKKFDKKDYEGALLKYKTTTYLDSTNHGAEYNIANTKSEKEEYPQADSLYNEAARLYIKTNQDKEKYVDDDFLSQLYHNKGNANMKQTMPIDSVVLIQQMVNAMGDNPQEGANAALQQLYPSLTKSLNNTQKAISDYKNSLRRNSQCDSTRFNLALAQDYEKRLLEILKNITPPQNQQNQQQNQQDKQNQQDQQQNQQNQQNNKEDERNQTDEKGEQKDDQVPDLSKENAEQILKAMEKDEENTLKKIRLKRNKEQQRRIIEKNW